MTDIDLDALGLDDFGGEVSADPRPDTFVLTLTDQDGAEADYELIDQFEHNGETYVVLLPPQAEGDDGEIEEILFLQRLSGDGDAEDYAGIEDDALLDELFDVFSSRCEIEEIDEAGAGEQ